MPQAIDTIEIISKLSYSCMPSMKWIIKKGSGNTTKYFCGTFSQRDKNHVFSYRNKPSKRN